MKLAGDRKVGFVDCDHRSTIDFHAVERESGGSKTRATKASWHGMPYKRHL